MKFFKLASCVLLLSVAILTFLINPGLAQQKTWSYDGVEYQLPKPMSEIQLPSEIPEYHEVVPGDCLWSIAGHYLNDPFLWPMIWEENLDTIENPHLIYPGQQVILPGGALVTSTEAAEVGMELDKDEGMEGEDTDLLGTGDTDDDKMAEGEPVDIAVNEPYPITIKSKMIASGYITKEKIEAPEIVGSETESYDLTTNNVIFFNGGTVSGFEPEQEFFVIRKMHEVNHPITGNYYGWMIHIVGEAKALCLGRDFSSAVLQTCYTNVLRGDLIIPKFNTVIPETLGSPPTDPCNPSTKKLPGIILDAFEGGEGFSDAVILGEGDIAYIDLGTNDGVAPGDYFTVFKHNMDDARLPRYVAGEAMVIKVDDISSTVVITQTKTALFIGDQIELKQ